MASTPGATTARPTPFSPRRNQASSITPASESSAAPGAVSAMRRADTHPPRAGTPTQQQPARKITAPVSVESRTRKNSKVTTVPLNTQSRPTSPAKRPYTPAPSTPTRSTTPMLSRRSSMCSSPTKSIFNGVVGPGDTELFNLEDALVDSNVLGEDISVEIDPSDLVDIMAKNHGAEDKVLVSVRIKPSNDASGWNVNAENNTIKLQEQFARTSVSTCPEFCFDEILTGSDNRSVYNTTAKSHVKAAMDGFNSVVFAYGQTASGKTFTLTGNEDEPGIIPRAMKDVFAYIRRTPTREFLLRASYLEIYNEQIHDLLSPTSISQPVGLQGVGANVVITPLREEVVTSFKSVRDVLDRGEGNRRTATTDWNERSSRSHSVFRLVIESRERTSSVGLVVPTNTSMSNAPVTPGGPLLQAKGGRSVRTSVLNLIDLAGSERATSDKDRTREGKFINTSLLTLGTVIGTLADNSAKSKTDHVPYRNSKLTRLLQPHLMGNARISVICTINPTPAAVTESTSTLLFAQRIKKVQISAQKKEVVDRDALIERLRLEIEDLKRRLEEREDAPVNGRRLSAREQVDESKAQQDLQKRIKQLNKLILTSQSVQDNKNDGAESPTKLNFDLSQYELQQQLLLARREMETQANQILSLEAALSARPPIPTDAPEDEKDKVILDQAKTIRELEIVVQGYEDNLGEPLPAIREDVEREWEGKVAAEKLIRSEKEAWAEELVRQLEKERQLRQKLEDEKKALQAYVSDIEQIQFRSRSLLPRPTTSVVVPLTETRKRTAPLPYGNLNDATNAVGGRLLAEFGKFKPQRNLGDVREGDEQAASPHRNKENLITS